MIGKIIEIRQETDDIKVFKIEPETKLEWKPGQFIMVDFGEFKRSYSIASTPEQGYIELCIKILPEGKASNKFKLMKTGDELELKGPFGKFNLEDDDAIYVALGAGIAPIMSMLRKTKKGILFYGFRNDSDYAYKKEIETLGIETHICISKPNKPEYTHYVGRVTEHIAEKIKLSKKNIYMCGMPAGIIEITKILEKKGFTKEQIRREMW